MYFYRKSRPGKARGPARSSYPIVRPVGKPSQTPRPAVTHLPSGREGDLTAHGGTPRDSLPPRQEVITALVNSPCSKVFRSLLLPKLYFQPLLFLRLHWVCTSQRFLLPEKSVVLRKSVTPKWADKPFRSLKVLAKALRK